MEVSYLCQLCRLPGSCICLRLSAKNPPMESPPGGMASGHQPPFPLPRHHPLACLSSLLFYPITIISSPFGQSNSAFPNKELRLVPSHQDEQIHSDHQVASSGIRAPWEAGTRPARDTWAEALRKLVIRSVARRSQPSLCGESQPHTIWWKHHGPIGWALKATREVVI